MARVPYLNIFLANSPSQPWSCYFCGEAVFYTFNQGRGSHKDALTVHRIDHDHANNAVENLAPAHGGCHSTHHGLTQVPRTLSDEHKRKIGEANRGRVLPPRTDAHKEKLSAAATRQPRKPHSAATKAKISVTMKQRHHG